MLQEIPSSNAAAVFGAPPQTQVAIEAYDPVEERTISGQTLQVYEIST
jgi:hypothetical protein